MTKDEVIARWAGFTEIEESTEVFADGHSEITPSGWVLEGDPTFYYSAPDFSDPTTLFKWCVPKLNELPDGEGWSLHYTPWFDEDKRYSVELYGPRFDNGFEVFASTPGEALRDAILSLIAEGEK